MQPTPAFPTLGTTVWVHIGPKHDNTPRYVPGIILADHISLWDGVRLISVSLELAPDRFGHMSRQTIQTAPENIYALV